MGDPSHYHRHGASLLVPRGRSLRFGGGGVRGLGVITASRTLLRPHLLHLRQVRLLNVKPDTVLSSLLPTADTDSGKSASSESSMARAASWSWSDSCRQSRGARGRSARTRRAAAQCCCRRASAV